MANEKRTIEADALKKHIFGIADMHNTDYLFVDMVVDAIDNAPTVDAVEVVRCKDCKYGEYDYTDHFDYYECRYIGGDWNKGDHFCSYGERKDNDG